MKVDHFAGQMGHNAKSIAQLVQGISDEQARWKPNQKTWSILEVVNHLHDEEREDFRIRVDIMLNRPDEPLPKFDPEAWPAERRYNERDLEESLGNFLREREESIRWLHSLKSPDWDAIYESSRLKMSAGDMFAAWVAHDLLHLRQLVRLKWLFATHELEPYMIDYAGLWK